MQSADRLSYSVTVSSRDAFSKYVRAAATSRQGVRLSYAAVCHPSGYIDFSPIQLQLPVAKGGGSMSARAMLSGDRGVTVGAGEGVLRITIGSVDTTILQTRLAQLVLSPLQQYNPYLVFEKVQDTKEMGRAMRRFRISQTGYWFAGYLLQEPMTGMPHLPRSMKNVTVSQVLDAIAKGFRGVVAYGECKNPNGTKLFRLDFYSFPGD